jgi:hypothetical protein
MLNVEKPSKMPRRPSGYKEKGLIFGSRNVPTLFTTSALHLQKHRLKVTALHKKTSWGYRRMQAPFEGGQGPEEVVDGIKVLFETVLPPD